jgi:sulfur carrier protein
MSDIRIKVNGMMETLPPASIAGLLSQRGIDAQARGLAVAVNHAVVPRARWAETSLATGDEIEIIKAISGG